MKRSVPDADLDRLLAARPIAPPAESARRWQILQRKLSPPPRHAWWRVPRRWTLVALPAAAALALVMWRSSTPAPVRDDFEGLLRLEESLEPARPLLDPLNRELCLELVPESRPPVSAEP